MRELTVSVVQASDPILLVIEAGNDSSAVVPEIALFKEQYPGGRVAVLGDHHRPADMVAAFRAGANVYFDREEARETFIKALELVMLGETILPPVLLSYVCVTHEEEAPKMRQAAMAMAELPQIDNGKWPQLSEREGSILRCIVEGDSNKVIARKIDIAEATVKVHVKAILRKIRVRNRTQAAMWAMSHPSCIQHTDGGRYPAIEGARLSLGARQASLSRLAEGQAVDPVIKTTSPT